MIPAGRSPLISAALPSRRALVGDPMFKWLPDGLCLLQHSGDGAGYWEIVSFSDAF